jgi:hypothetical protein
MSMAIQLEFNIDGKSPEELRLHHMQLQINQMNESMGKVRRKLFSEVSEMKKLYVDLQKENEGLKSTLRKMNNEESIWVYGQEGSLFDVREYQKATG